MAGFKKKKNIKWTDIWPDFYEAEPKSKEKAYQGERTKESLLRRVKTWLSLK